MLEAVLFDLDGVLVDTESISSKASEKVLGRHGIFLTDEEKRHVFGRRTIDNYRDHIQARGLDLDAGQLVGEKNDLFKKLIEGNLEPLPGVLRLLDILEASNVKTAVVSSSPLERVEATLMEADLFWRFPLIISGPLSEKGKPDR